MTREGSEPFGRGCTVLSTPLLVAVRAALIACGCVLLTACGSDGAVPEAGADGASKEVAGSASLRGTIAGLETQTWVVNDTTGEVGRALAGYGAGEWPGKAEQVRVWRAAGLRIVAVPEADVPKVRGVLSLIGPLQQRWNGELAKWTPILAGPSWEGERELSIASGAGLREREPVMLSAGRIRLLARAYVMPTLAGEKLESRLTIELVPQHEEPDGSARALSRQLRGGGKAEQRGMVFRRMAVEFVARPGECYFITGDAPEMEWVADGERSNDAPGPEMSREGRVEGAPTLGEAMLTDVNREGTMRARVVLVLTPKIPGTFTLLGR
ncbi:MAG: hypothetical protein IT434_08775 [Phycisphaerales bacterium]|jgi:hypothetical protein|nr:hypothetical protein [Phycisphaerales bacterium]